MRHFLSLTNLALSLSLACLACGGNVALSSGGGGGGGGDTTTTTASTTSTADEFTACTGPGECVLTYPGCCPGCSIPELGEVVAVSATKADAYHKSICPEQPPCPLCDQAPNPNLFAYCKDGACVAADVRKEPMSACTSSADCVVRATAECCEPCVPEGWQMITLTPDGEGTLGSLVCAPDIGCPACEPQYPPSFGVVCGADGHCAFSEF